MSAAPKINQSLQRSPQYILTVIKGANEGAIYKIVSKKITVGRAENNNITFADDSKVSRKHLEINFEGFQPTVTNVSSQNVIFIDGKKSSQSPLKDGSIITVGTHQLKLTVRTLKQTQNVPATPPPLNRPLNKENNMQAKPNLNGRNLKPLNLPSDSPDDFPVHFQQPNNNQPQSFGSPGAIPGQTTPHNNRKKQSSGRVKFYIVVFIIGIGLYALLSGNKKSEDLSLKIRTSEEILKDLDVSKKRQEAIKELRQKKGVSSKQFSEAQSSYIRCFRNYQQGQYSRAIQGCQAALALFPNHKLATRYLNLSKRKKDEKVQELIIQGKLYKDRGFYERCHSTLLTAMNSISSRSAPLYKEASQLDSECKTLMEGKY